MRAVTRLIAGVLPLLLLGGCDRVEPDPKEVPDVTDDLCFEPEGELPHLDFGVLPVDMVRLSFARTFTLRNHCTTARSLPTLHGGDFSQSGSLAFSVPPGVRVPAGEEIDVGVSVFLQDDEPFDSFVAVQNSSVVLATVSAVRDSEHLLVRRALPYAVGVPSGCAVDIELVLQYGGELPYALGDAVLDEQASESWEAVWEPALPWVLGEDAPGPHRLRLHLPADAPDEVHPFRADLPIDSPFPTAHVMISSAVREDEPQFAVNWPVMGLDGSERIPLGIVPVAETLDVTVAGKAHPFTYDDVDNTVHVDGAPNGSVIYVRGEPRCGEGA